MHTYTMILNVYCTQNLGHKIGGAVFMSKLTRKDKIEIYERSKNKEGTLNLWLNLRKMRKFYLKKIRLNS